MKTLAQAGKSEQQKKKTNIYEDAYIDIMNGVIVCRIFDHSVLVDRCNDRYANCYHKELLQRVQ